MREDQIFDHTLAYFSIWTWVKFYSPLKLIFCEDECLQEEWINIVCQTDMELLKNTLGEICIKMQGNNLIIDDQTLL